MGRAPRESSLLLHLAAAAKAIEAPIPAVVFLKQFTLITPFLFQRLITRKRAISLRMVTARLY